jgi:Dual specificity protein phosphatase, N-terminal half
MKLNEKLADTRLKEKAIYYYSGTHPHRRANAAFLISAWSMLYTDKVSYLNPNLALAQHFNYH